jgi:hypothetical protein
MCYAKTTLRTVVSKARFIPEFICGFEHLKDRMRDLCVCRTKRWNVKLHLRVCKTPYWRE